MRTIIPRILSLLGAALSLALFARGALAVEPGAWPYYPLDPDFFRGSGTYVGNYLSVWKILACWLLFLAWVRSSDWVNQDAQIQRLRYSLWNPIVVGSFAVAFLLVWVIPAFWFGMLLMTAAYVGPLGSYIFYRNAHVEEHRKVLTPAHLRFWLARRLGKVGVQIEEEKSLPQDRGPEVTFKPNGATPQSSAGRLLDARQLPGYVPARVLMADALEHHSDAVLVDLGAESAVARFLIDGVWHNHQAHPRETGRELLLVFKTLSVDDAPAADAAAGSQGPAEFGVEFQGAAYTCLVTTQSSEGGQRMLLKLQSRQAGGGPKTLEALGMRSKSAEQLRGLLGAAHGFLLFTAVPGGGLTTTLDAALEGCDRFVRDFVAVEELRRRERDITGIDVVTYDAAAGQSPAALLPKLFRRQPNVVVVRDLVDGETVRQLSAEAKGRLVIGAVAARDACEALLRVLLLKVPPPDFAAAVTAVVHCRLIRTLCENCKESYPPSAATLAQLGIPAGKVTALYRPRQDRESLCDQCRGIGYRGRTGLLELLPINDPLRSLLVKSPKIDLLRQAAREAGVLSARDQAILMVARGLTSIEEAQRALKN